MCFPVSAGHQTRAHSGRAAPRLRRKRFARFRSRCWPRCFLRCAPFGPRRAACSASPAPAAARRRGHAGGRGCAGSAARPAGCPEASPAPAPRGQQVHVADDQGASASGEPRAAAMSQRPHHGDRQRQRLAIAAALAMGEPRRRRADRHDAAAHAQEGPRRRRWPRRRPPARPGPAARISPCARKPWRSRQSRMVGRDRR